MSTLRVANVHLNGAATALIDNPTGDVVRILAGGSEKIKFDQAGRANVSGDLNVTGSVSDGLGGIRTVPVAAKTATYAITRSDVGNTISITAGGIFVPNAVFSTGDNVVIYNNSNTSQTITPNNNVVMFDAGNAGTGGQKTLLGRGLATIYCVAANTFVISGAGLS